MNLADAVQRLYVCPKCRGRLTLLAGGDAGSGSLSCSNRHSFAIRDELPRFVESAGYAASFGFQWQAHARDQLDSATGTTISRTRLFKGTQWPERMPGELILEAGCGSGRFTEVLLSTGAEVISFDYSAAAEMTHRAFSSRGARSPGIHLGCPTPRQLRPRLATGHPALPDVRGVSALVSMVSGRAPGGRRGHHRRGSTRYRALVDRDRQELHRWCQKIVPLYIAGTTTASLNQLFVPIRITGVRCRNHSGAGDRMEYPRHLRCAVTRL
jgi:uncharacterized protein YbaR (Trm112 family)